MGTSGAFSPMMASGKLGANKSGQGIKAGVGTRGEGESVQEPCKSFDSSQKRPQVWHRYRQQRKVEGGTGERGVQ